jgi:DNA-binding NarL/FixJ family response regulator
LAIERTSPFEKQDDESDSEIQRFESMPADQVVNLTPQGFKNSDMATKLSLREQTVKNHLHYILKS